MPWITQDATQHTKKATTASKKLQWSKVANAVIKKTNNDAKAIKIANGIIKKEKKKK